MFEGDTNISSALTRNNKVQERKDEERLNQNRVRDTLVQEALLVQRQAKHCHMPNWLEIFLLLVFLHFYLMIGSKRR
jgi:hypothetical protein